MQPAVNIAVRAARRAGEIIVRSINRLESLKVETKGRNDFATEVDRAAEQEIIAILSKAYPTHAFLGEEGGRSGDSETVWIIDPLDGTTNYLHGFPTYAVSIACRHRGRLEHAVIYDPMRQEIFTASRGDGAAREPAPAGQQTAGHRGRAGRDRIPFRANADHRCLSRATEGDHAIDSRCAPACAAAHTRLVAAGRVDGFWEFGLNPWDTAAGALLIQEAGGRIGTLTGRPYDLSPHIVAGTPRVYETLLELIAPHVPAALRDA